MDCSLSVSIQVLTLCLVMFTEGLRFWDLRSGDRTADISGTSARPHHGPEGWMGDPLYSLGSQCIFLLISCSSGCAAIHEGAITSVQFQPTVAGGGGSSSVGPHVLTNSMDSSLKVVDVRTGTALFALRDADLVTSYGWSRACFSPDGAYILGASNSTGHVLVWSAVDGTLKAKLSDQHGGSGVCGIDWGRGGTNGQQVASIDRTGVLILWA